MKKVLAFLVVAFMAVSVAFAFDDCPLCPTPCDGCATWTDRADGNITADFVCPPVLRPDDQTKVLGRFFTGKTYSVGVVDKCHAVLTWFLKGPQLALYTFVGTGPTPVDPHNQSILQGDWTIDGTFIGPILNQHYFVDNKLDCQREMMIFWKTRTLDIPTYQQPLTCTAWHVTLAVTVSL